MMCWVQARSRKITEAGDVAKRTLRGNLQDGYPVFGGTDSVGPPVGPTQLDVFTRSNRTHRIRSRVEVFV